MQGQTLAGRYHIIKHLGGGGFGQTYLAEDKKRSGNPRCVVKQLKPKSEDPKIPQIARRLFQTEIETLHQLGTHPMIPELLDSFEENQEFYLVQGLIEGENLNKEITPGRRLSEPEVIAILRDIIEILVFVQKHNFIHRDIDPSNLMRRQSDGRIVLIDFGAAKRIGTQIINSGGQIAQTVAVGKKAYMPPEQMDGYPNLSSDIYAVGMICIQALTGILPQHLIKKNGEINWRNQAEVSDNLANILDKMVRNDFHKRYQSAAEVWEVINNLRTPSVSTKISSSSNLFTVTSTWTREHKIAFAGVGLAVIFGAAWLLTPEIRKMMGLEAAGNFVIYENRDLGIKMQYPEKWNKQENINPITNEVVEFITPQESNADSFLERLVVTVEPTSNQTLYEYTKLSKQEILRLDKNAKIAQEGESTLASKNGYRVIYTTKEGDRELKKLEVWTLKYDKAYFVTYVAEAGKYEQFLPVVEKMIKSLEVAGTK